MIKPLVFALLMGSAFGAAQVPALGDDASDLIKKELERFQGTWQLISAESDGEKAPEDRVKQIQVKITGNKHTVTFGEQVIARDVRFEIDPAATPKKVTDTLENGPEKGKKVFGIYRLENEMLTSCVAAISKERPEAFESKPGSGHTLRIFRRIKE